MTGHSIIGAGILLGGNQNFDGSDWKTIDWPPLYDPKTDDSIHPRMRRRMSRLSCMVVRATRRAGGLEAGDEAPLLFATANGEINTIGLILDTLVDPGRSVSPTHFHNSVHNAGPGYWSIGAKRRSPTTTLTMADLSVECALLDAWARLECGIPEVQITAGDEAVVGPSWADPPHCTHDFCGSLRIAVGQVPDAIGRLLHVEMGLLGNDETVHRMEASLVERFSPTEVIADLPGTERRTVPPLPGDASNPCGSLFFILRFLMDPERQGNLLYLKTGRGGAISSVVVGKESHD